MNSDAKKISAAAQVDGVDGQWLVKCDIHHSPPNPPVAVLFWGPSMSIVGAITRPLDLELLSPSSTEGVAFDYVGDPIPIPKALAEMRPEPLSDAGFRLGFFQVPSD